MSRIAARVIVFLLLGAIVNVVVAWGCFFFCDRPEIKERPITESETRWLAANGERAYVEIDDGVRTYSSVSQYAGIGVRIVLIHLYSPEFYEKLDHLIAMASQAIFTPPPRVDVVKCGLPFYSLSTSEWHHSDEWMAQRKSNDWFERTGAIVLTVKEDEWCFPIRPLWPGFAINTIFYAAVLWVIFFAPFALRRRLRVRRGLCPACAYPIGSSPVCTECGRAVMQRTPL